MGIPIAEPYIAACHMKNNSSQSQNGVFIPLQPLIEWCFEWVWALPVGNVKQLWLQHPRSTELFVVSFCTTKWPEGMSYFGIVRLHFCLFLPKGQSQSFDLTNPATTFQTRERGGQWSQKTKNSYTLIKQTNNNVQCLWWHTTTLQGALNKSGSYAAPWGPIPNFFRSYESSLHLQTFLLLDLWSQGNGLGGDAFSSIKSSPIIYYIEIYRDYRC